MRLIGNKTKLLGDIEQLLESQGVRGGTLIDIFAGTSSVGRHFKRRGFRVLANDRMASCFAQAVAAVEVSCPPAFRRFRDAQGAALADERFREEFFAEYGPRGASERRDDGGEPLREAIHFLGTRVAPREGLVFRSFSDGGPHGRRYFTAENGRRIDGMLEFLTGGLRRGILTRGEFFLLLSALIDAADRVANISGTYGAYLKQFQMSARRPLTLVVPDVVSSGHQNRAYQEDANRLVRRLEGDVLYIDPPYNKRQYPANYHVLEVLARHHAVDDLDAFEASLYGKTGLLPYADERSDFCVAPRAGRRAPRGADTRRGDVASAMLDLVTSTKARHVVISYNEEGLLGREEIGGMLCRFAGRKTFDWKRGFREIAYRRFRSDHDRPAADHNGSSRSYKVLEGRAADEIHEWLFFASRDRAGAGR